MLSTKISVDDRLQLQELIWRYSIARDDKDLTRLLECFTDDARFVRRGSEVVGLKEIDGFFRRSMARYDLTTHTNHGQVLDPVADDQVNGLVAGHAELVLDGRLHVASYRYADQYRRAGQKWLIARRSLMFLYAMPVEELSTGFTDRLRIRWFGEQPAEADYPETLPTWSD
jgi:ketosteroid isomerase-like protein